jgi:3-hydroxybutyryl-CoA dehydrogenase
MIYSIVRAGVSRSFEEPHPFTEGACEGSAARVYIGSDCGRAFAAEWVNGAVLATAPFIAIELGAECLGVHTGVAKQGEAGGDMSHVFGFARFKLGAAEASNLIELVKPANADETALGSLKSAFESAGFKVAVCGDFPGRIVDRLVRPYYNAALRRLDERLASAADLDATLRLGLGYPEGPIALLDRTGLADHYVVTKALYEALGDAAYAPARRAQIAHARSSGAGEVIGAIK